MSRFSRRCQSASLIDARVQLARVCFLLSPCRPQGLPFGSKDWDEYLHQLSHLTSPWFFLTVMTQIIKSYTSIYHIVHLLIIVVYSTHWRPFSNYHVYFLNPYLRLECNFSLLTQHWPLLYSRFHRSFYINLSLIFKSSTMSISGMVQSCDD